MTAQRSLLFVPGNRPDRFAKAVSAGADMVCVDLEDAVPVDSKATARESALSWLLEADNGPTRAIRINSIRTATGLRDLVALAEAAPVKGLVLLPKVDTQEEIGIADAILTEAGSGVGLMALVEGVQGLQRVPDIAEASPRLKSLMLGAVDLASELGCDLAHEPLLYSRSRIVHAARCAGIAALDVPSLNFRDSEAVGAEARVAKSLGFTGKAVIHPDNVAVVNAVFTPTAEEAARARQIVDAFAASSSGLVVIDGRLVERPVIRKMEQVLAAANLADVG